MSDNVYEVESSLTSCKAYFLPTIKPRQRHRHYTFNLDCNQNFLHSHSLCVGILFNSTALGIHLCKTSQPAISKRGLVVKFARLT